MLNKLELMRNVIKNEDKPKKRNCRICGNFGIFSLPIQALSLFTWINEASSNVRDLSPLIWGLNDMMEYAK